MQHDRPAEFDSAVMAYMPGLRNLAAKYKPREYQEDLVVDTIMHALEKWRNFRADGNMWHWLAWTMRGIVKNEATKAATRSAVQFVELDDRMQLTTPAAQEHRVELTEALTRLRRIKGGGDVVRHAMGHKLHEIGRRKRVGAERARQVIKAARGRLLAA